MQEILWGVDLGGTKIEAVAIQPDGKVLSRQRLPTEQEHGYEHIVQQIRAVLHLVSKDIGTTPTCLGIGTPGAIDPPTGLLKNSNTTVLNGRPFREDLQTALGIPVQMANDANCFAMAEAVLGAGKRYATADHLIFGIIMGTGVGGGIVINGQVWAGAQGIGGEWGHSFLDASGGTCYCGQVGCVETLISGPGLERYYAQVSGEKRHLASILAAYEQGSSDVHVQATVERLLHFFGRGLANLIDTLDPTAIVIGGGLSKIDLLYTEGVDRISQYVFNTRLDTPILRPLLGDSAGVFGAAMLTKI
ncbi:MAG: sugar kinase [Bacteroidetes bacterium]|nr:MAG: sugar kinase [Bacteroidota bacterium]PTM12908.1 MAG: sugar kinase [Bacteroidota bacterium]